MAEWLILLLLVPAIMVPVVLLVGFAGCNQVFGIKDTVAQPIIDDAIPLSGSIIRVIWGYGSAADHFAVERTNPDGSTPVTDAPSSPFNDSGLTPATTYKYRVSPVVGNQAPSDWSDYKSATTLAFQATFEEKRSGDSSPWEGYTLVQRLEAVRLSTNGTQVLITVQAHSTIGASIDRIYISQPDPNKPNRYDSIDPQSPPVPGQLTKVYDKDFDAPGQPVTVPPGKDADGNDVYYVFGPVGPVAYNLDHTQALLIAIDFSAAPASSIRDAGPLPISEAAAYYYNGAAEAAKPTRTAGYIQAPQGGDPNTSFVNFIAKIEVA